jgi:inner membrane protein
LAGAALSTAFSPPRTYRRLWIAGPLCAALPDVDALGRPFGNLAYESVFGGHRGLTHSLAFAVVVGAVAVVAFFRDPRWDGARFRVWACLFLATASHGFLDALSTIGDGVAFFAPFSFTHYAFTWQPLGDIGARGGLVRLPALIANELLWVGLPSLIVVAIAVLVRRVTHGRRWAQPAAQLAVATDERDV